MIAGNALVDTNILVDATHTGRPHHRDALALLESPAALVVSAQVIREYLVVATRPIDANGLGLTMADALDNVRAFRRGLRLLPEERPVLPTFLALLDRSPCSGKRVHDGHLFATALAHGVRTIVSLNPADFRPFGSDVVVLSPSEALRGGGPARWREETRAWGARQRARPIRRRVAR